MAELRTAEGPTVPFRCGTQSGDWQIGNCEGRGHKPRCLPCAKAVIYDGTQEAADRFWVEACPIQQAISAGAITGEVPREIMERMGFFANRDKYTWPCPEYAAGGGAVKGDSRGR